MSRVLLKRVALAGLALGAGAGLYHAFSGPSRSAEFRGQPTATAHTPPAELSTGQAPSIAATPPALDCKTLGPMLGSLQDLTLEELQKQLAPLGPPTEETHWENTFYRAKGEDFVWHLVPSESAEGVERWELKHFREDADGPTLLASKAFLGRREALEYRRTVVTADAVTERKLSWNYASGLSVTMTASKTVRDLRATSSGLRLDCSPKGCECRAGN